MAPVKVHQKFSHVEIPCRKSSQLLKLDATRGKRHAWGRTDREALCLLFRLYKNSTKDLNAIFNDMFSSELHDEGFTDGLHTSVFVTQWHDMRLGSNGNDIWVKIHKKLLLKDVRSLYREIRNSIEDSAICLGIELCLRVQDPASEMQHSTKISRKARHLEAIRSVLGDTLSPEPWNDDDNESPRKKRRTKSAGDMNEARLLEPDELRLVRWAPSVRALMGTDQRPFVSGKAGRMAVASAKALQGYERQVPLIVYRFTNDQSQGFNGSKELRAGRFIDTGTLIPAPPREDVLSEEVSAHLSLANRRSTPFVSVFQDMLYALKRALADPPGKVHSRITVIDLQKVASALEERFGKGTESVFLVDEIRRRCKLKLDGGYPGKREWLIYGIVPETAQAVVASFRVDEVFPLRLLAPEYCAVLRINELRGRAKMGGCRSKLKARAKDLNKETGTAVGRLITTMDIEDPACRELVAAGIARSWAFKIRGKKENCYREYIDGVFENANSVRDPSVESAYFERELDIPWSDEEDDFQSAGHSVTTPEGCEDDVPLGRSALTESHVDRRCPLIAADSEDHSEDSNDTIRQLADISGIDEDQDQIDQQLQNELLAYGGRQTHISPSPEVRGTSINTFGRGVLQAAAIRSPSAAALAHISNWRNWSSITPQPQHEATTSRAAAKSIFVVDLSNDTDEEDARGMEEGTREKNTKVVRKAVKRAGKRQTQIMGPVKKAGFAKRWQPKMAESGDEDEVTEIPSVDLCSD